jgi:hypothetical protein
LKVLQPLENCRALVSPQDLKSGIQQFAKRTSSILLLIFGSSYPDRWEHFAQVAVDQWFLVLHHGIPMQDGSGVLIDRIDWLKLVRPNNLDRVST